MTHSLAWLVLAALVWPTFVVVALMFSYLAGEGSVLNTWYLEPKRNLLAHFIKGYKGSAGIAAAIAAVAILCGAAPRSVKALRLAVIIILPLAGFIIAGYFYTDAGSVQPAFVCTGAALAVISLVLSGIARRINR